MMESLLRKLVIFLYGQSFQSYMIFVRLKAVFYNIEKSHYFIQRYVILFH